MNALAFAEDTAPNSMAASPRRRRRAFTHADMARLAVRHLLDAKRAGDAATAKQFAVLASTEIDAHLAAQRQAAQS